MTRHAVPPDFIRGFDAIAAEVSRVRAAIATGHATLDSLRAAEAAAIRLRNAAPALAQAARRARIEAERTQRQIAARGGEVIDDRIAQMRREAASRSDLSIPAMPA